MFKGVSKETRVGVLAAVAITVLILGYNFMIGKDNPFTSARVFYVQYDSVPGLVKSAAVLYRGKRIGQIKDITIGNAEKITVKLEVFEKIIIPIDSKVKQIPGLIGAPVLSLELGKSATIAKDGSTLIAAYQAGMLDGLTGKIDPITKRTDSILAEFQKLIKRQGLQKTIDALPMLVQNVTDAIGGIKLTIEAMKPGLGGSLDNLNKFTANLDDYNKSIKGSLQSFQNLSKKIDSIQVNQLVASLEKTVNGLSEVASNMQKGEGTLGALANDKQLYTNLVSTTNSLNCLINDLKTYPEKYVPLPWGKKQRRKAKEQSNKTNNCFPAKDSSKIIN